MRINEYFGENVFSKAVMKERLPRDVYRELERVERAQVQEEF